MRKFFSDKNLHSNPFLNWIELLAIMVFLWFVMSGVFEIKFIVFGIVSALIISLYCLVHLTIGGLKSDKSYFILHVNYFKFIVYFLWLVVQITISALSVSMIIISGKKKVKPKIIWFKADYDNPAARALLANSITLTPGTVTVDIYDDGIYSVHALNQKMADGLLNGDMQNKIAKLYNETIDYKVIDTYEVNEQETVKYAQLIQKKYPGKAKKVI